MTVVVVSSFSLLFLLILWTPPVQSYPDGGRVVCLNRTTCAKGQALLSGGKAYVKLDYFEGLTLDKLKNVTVTVEARDFHCGNCPTQSYKQTYNVTKSSLIVTGNITLKSCAQTRDSVQSEGANDNQQSRRRREPAPDDENLPTNKTTTTDDKGNPPNGTAPKPTGSTPTPTGSTPKPTGTTPKPTGNGSWDSSSALYTVDSIGVYHIAVTVTGEGQEALKSISITLENPYGYLDAADYPAMVFYSIMLVVYVSLAVVWTVLLCCSYKDLIILQLFIAVVILLGVLEKTFLVAEYAAVNERGESSKGYFPAYLVVAEGVSALKKTFARVLLIIVSLGYGTVIPRLGGKSKLLILFGVVCFATAFGEGLSRAFYYVTRDGIPPAVLGAFIPQLVMEVIFIYWVIGAIKKTHHTLRLRENTKKLAFSILLYTFVFAVICIIAFCLWFYISGFVKKCEDLQSLWLKDCYWHIIFTALLIVIMILWRPSANPVPSDYLPVPDEEEEEMEQKVNKNLETMSKRQRAKGDEVAPPRPSHDMEEDLK